MPGGERKARDDIRYYPRLQRGGLSGLLSGRCAALRPRRFRAAAGQRRLHRPQPGNAGKILGNIDSWIEAAIWSSMDNFSFSIVTLSKLEISQFF